MSWTLCWPNKQGDRNENRVPRIASSLKQFSNELDINQRCEKGTKGISSRREVIVKTVSENATVISEAGSSVRKTRHENATDSRSTGEVDQVALALPFMRPWPSERRRYSSFCLGVSRDSAHTGISFVAYWADQGSDDARLPNEAAGETVWVLDS